MKKVHWNNGKRPEKTGAVQPGIVSYGNLLFISGIGAHFEGDIKAHTKHVLDEVQKSSRPSGSSMEKVLKVNVYLNDLKDYAGMNEMFLGRFGPEPGRAYDHRGRRRHSRQLARRDRLHRQRVIPDRPAARQNGGPPPTPSAGADTAQFRPPAISLPKGGGAIHGMGEKFTTNLASGTGAMAIPIPVSSGRGGVGPALDLRYDSGAGNGPFGLGWQLGLPAIARKTDKGLPQYRDAAESDVFILSGPEDLVPVLVANGDQWIPEAVPDRTIDTGYLRHSPLPAAGRGALRPHRAVVHTTTPPTSSGACFPDNVTTWYGRTRESRIDDPEHPERIYTWSICESRDDKGNAVRYTYQGEDDVGVDRTRVEEVHRTPRRKAARRTVI